MLYAWIAGGTYAVDLFAADVSVCILLLAMLVQSKGFSLLYRSLLCILFIDSVADVLMLGGYYLNLVDTSAIETVVFCIMMLYLIWREYERPTDLYDASNINILLYRPKSYLDVMKAVIGFPTSSICISTDNYVWAFRKRSDMFEKVPYTDAWATSHIIINTGIPKNNLIVAALDEEIGDKRVPYCKCIWSIRKALNLLGGKYRIKSPLDYIPGIYASRIIRGNHA